MTIKDEVFKALLLIARPAAGKSEIIDYLTKIPPAERIKTFHIGEFLVIDDFPMLWTWFEEDEILSRLGHERLHSNKKGGFKDVFMWDVLIERLCLEYKKYIRDHPFLGSKNSAILEFSRGSEHGGYRRAFEHLSLELIQDLAILYIDVSWEESLRKNRLRFNPDKPDSILEHGLTDENLEKLYKVIDWHEIAAGNTNYLLIKDMKVPYRVFENNDDVTTKQDKTLGWRLRDCLDQLWLDYQRIQSDYLSMVK